MRQEYRYKGKSYEFPLNNTRKFDLYSNICNVLENLNLSTFCHADNVYDLIDKYLSDFNCNYQLKIGAFIFYTWTFTGIAYQLNRISGRICSNISDIKKLLKLIQVVPQQNILSNDISMLIEPLLSFTSSLINQIE